MADASNEIREWLLSQQDWLQKAAEILLAEGTVSDAQIDELVACLKTPEGQNVTTHRKFEGLAANTSAAGALRLTEIGDISGIENLAPRRPLNFGQGSLCVIYGHNGSGKSGYTRILNKVCGKPRSPDLKPNVFDSPPAKRGCKVSFSINGVGRKIEWVANSDPIDELTQVDTFDADTASAYLTQEKPATYTPPFVSLFEELASVCNRIKEELQSEQGNLISALPRLPNDYAATPAGSAYHRLTADLAESAIKPLIQWEQKDEKSVEQLCERLKAVDPARLARSKRSTKQQIEQLASRLKSAATAFGKERLEAMRQIRSDASDRRRIATEAANVDSAKLDGVGTDTWRALWEAARTYSQTAYPGQQYPVTDDARCVLCHQELGDKAKHRLHEFEKFVQGQLESEATAAEEAYKLAMDAVPQGLTEEQVTTICQAAGLSDSPLAAEITESWRQIGAMRATLLDHESKQRLDPLSWPTKVLEELNGRSQALEQEAVQHDDDAKNFDREKAIKEKLELEARKWTAQQADSILAEIERLQQVASYEKWKRLANSQGVSRKAGEIAEQVINPAPKWI